MTLSEINEILRQLVWMSLQVGVILLIFSVAIKTAFNIFKE